MRNRGRPRNLHLPRATLALAIGAGIGEAMAMWAARGEADLPGLLLIAGLTVPYGILAWMAHRYRDRRVMKPLLFLTVLCLAAWGLSNLFEDVYRSVDPNHHKVAGWGSIIVLCGNWITVAVMWWSERLLSRFSWRRGSRESRVTSHKP